MNREIKFRAWDPFNERMFTVDTYWWEEMGTCEKDFSVMKSLDGKCILMQYTGLKDKNGREIYEGDIVKRFKEVNVQRYGYYICEVKYSLPRACFQLIKQDHECFGWPSKTEEKLEIIGNIYENPELLENAE